MRFLSRHGLVCRQLMMVGKEAASRQQRYQLYRVSFFSQSAYQDPALVWAQSNPRLAQACLTVPPIDTFGSLAGNEMDSLDSFLEWRRWKFPKELNDEESSSDSGGFGDPTENAKALISHILSAPLTLASQFKDLTKDSTGFNIKDGKTEISYCCVGARAEASIPVEYWKEFLMFSWASMYSPEDISLSSRTSIPANKNLRMSMDFIGPDLPPKLSELSVSITERQGINNDPSSVASLSIRGYHRGLFHTMPSRKATDPNVKSWGAYIFFNPGFGHPNLRKSWEPTMKTILNERRKNPSKLLLTAHSEADMARDASILDNIYGLKNILYHENPFASRVTYEDPFEKNHFVRPNHYVATIEM